MAVSATEFFRIVRTIPPTEGDFLSYEALGLPLLAGATEAERRIWSGVSVYSTQAQARQAFKMTLFTGYAGVARLLLPSDEGLCWERTPIGGRGHHTIWAPADRLVAYVQESVPLFRRQG